MAELIVERLEVIDVAHQQRSGSPPALASATVRVELGIEIFAVGEAGQRIGQALGPDRSRGSAAAADLLLAKRIAALRAFCWWSPSPWRRRSAVRSPRAMRCRRRRRADCCWRLAALHSRPPDLPNSSSPSRRRRRSWRALRDFADHARADVVEPSVTRPGKVGIVDLLDVGFVELAFLRQRLVDGSIESRIVSRGVLIPDLEIARRCGLPERPDLLKRDFGEGQCTFVLVACTALALLRFNLKYRDTLSQHDVAVRNARKPKSKR